MKRFILFGLLGGLLATNTGCGLLQAVFCYRPCATRGDYSTMDPMCDDGCGPTCGPTCSARPVRAPVHARRAAYVDGDVGCGAAYGRPCRVPNCQSCNPCDDACADPCGSGCYGRCWHRGPLSCVFALFMHGCWGTGGCSSCGERYWGDFYSDSPDCWDPCDGQGNYTGVPNAGPGGCKSCGGGRNMNYGFDEGAPMSGENIVSQTERTVSPRPAGQPHKAARAQ